MERVALTHLQDWMQANDRKPMVIRGARQVGKTWLVRHLAQISGKQLIELNLEKQPAYTSLFKSNEPDAILLALSAAFDKPITSENSLLFLDEIQVAPELLAKLRWFAEEMPHLPVIAAGSLLEFVLAEHSFSMPVGRINYLHLEPLSFEEFLLANNKRQLLDYLKTYNLKVEIPAMIHQQHMQLFKEYLLIGGMPAVVASWVSEHSLHKINQLQYDLLATYRDDFAKYRGRLAVGSLNTVLMAVPKMLGNKFVLSHVDSSMQSTAVKQILDLLGKAKICHRIFNCSVNGIPLAAEIKEKFFKEIFLDTGLCASALGLNLNQISAIDEITLINNGGIAEQVVGQLLRTIEPYYVEPALYYWQREEKNSNAEIDYIVQHGSQVVPVEVKAGSIGSLKSLHVFMKLKKLEIAVRINSGLPNMTPVNVKDHTGSLINYNLLSIPFYLIGQLHRLLDVL